MHFKRKVIVFSSSWRFLLNLSINDVWTGFINETEGVALNFIHDVALNFIHEPLIKSDDLMDRLMKHFWLLFTKYLIKWQRRISWNFRYWLNLKSSIELDTKRLMLYMLYLSVPFKRAQQYTDTEIRHKKNRHTIYIFMNVALWWLFHYF